MANRTLSDDRIIRNRNLETRYAADDFVNPTSFDSHDPKQLAYVILNAGYVQAIVFAEYPAYCEQDAFDEAADSGKLDGFQVTEQELADYEVGKDSEGFPEYEGIWNLGNASEPFAGESFDCWIVKASVFADDPALMTSDRVVTRLEEIRDAAEDVYKGVSVDSDDWSSAYRATQDIADALTLARLAIAR